MRIWRVCRKIWRSDLVDELVDEGRIGKLSALLVQDHFERRPERERDNRLWALRFARPEAVGYEGGCDQVGDKIECRPDPDFVNNKV